MHQHMNISVWLFCCLTPLFSHHPSSPVILFVVNGRLDTSCPLTGGDEDLFLAVMSAKLGSCFCFLWPLSRL